MDDHARELQAARERIDELDRRLQELIAERARLARAVGATKSAAAAEFYRPEREAQVLRAVVERNAGPLGDEEMVRLFREIMSACLSQQEPLRVGYLGPEGTFSQQAALHHFGHSIREMPLSTIEEVFTRVEAGEADFGVVPVENSTAGTVMHTLDMFLGSPLSICGEVEIRIRQHLLGRVTRLDEIARVCAHPQSLAQCRAWLRQHLPAVELEEVASNAEGARRARDEARTAAIAGDAAAAAYDMRRVAEDIEDRSDNTTRFLVVGRKLLAPSGDDRTTLLISPARSDRAGSLHELLEPLARCGVNMTRIESRPSRRRAWHYVFFLDLDGHREEPALAQALRELEARAESVRVLGSYPRAVL